MKRRRGPVVKTTVPRPAKLTRTQLADMNGKQHTAWCASVQAYEAARLVALRAEYATNRAIAAIPYDERTDSFLHDTCCVRDVAPDHDRVVMIARLRALDAGQVTMTAALTTEVHQPAPTQFLVLHQPVPVYARGELQLLGLPHEVIRNCIFSRVSTRDLFSLLYTCRYLQEDAQLTLRLRAEQLFGPGASPMACSVQLFYMDMFGDPSDIRTEMIDDNFIVDDSSDEDDEFSIERAITATIVRYGSIEGLLVEQERQKQFRECHEKERTVRAQAVRDRIVTCNELLAKHGYPPFFVYNPNRRNSIEWCAGCWLYLYIVDDARIMTSALEAFIRTGKPVLTATLERRIVALESPLLARVLSLARGMDYPLHQFDSHNVREVAKRLYRTNFTLFDTPISDEDARACFEELLLKSSACLCVHSNPVASHLKCEPFSHVPTQTFDVLCRDGKTTIRVADWTPNQLFALRTEHAWNGCLFVIREYQ